MPYMNPSSHLRSAAEKWFGPPGAWPWRVMRYGRTTRGVRYVWIEALRPAGARTIIFFRHPDSAWRVFPPDAEEYPMLGRPQRRFQNPAGQGHGTHCALGKE